MLAAAQALPDWSQGLSPRILLIEDQRDVAANIWDFLDRRGYVLDHAVDGVTGLRLALARPYDVIVLDLGLPRLDGLDLCAELRSAGRTTPVLMLTARDTLDDKLRGFARGADDYVVKPFGFRELVARIHAVMRRAGATGASPDQDIEIGPLRVDRRTREVRYEDRTVDLAPREYDLLVHLATDPGAVRTRSEIIRTVWDEHWWGSTKTLDVHVASLRKKLAPELIQTIRSVGYRLVDPTSDDT